MSSHRRFRWLLPLLAFAITFVALAVPASILYQRLRLSPRGAANTVHFYMPKQSVARFVLLSVTNLEEKPITAVHLPGMVGEALVSAPTTWPSSYHPVSLPFWAWRCISVPCFCLPFWYLVGYGWDHLRARRRTHWAVLLFGTLLSAGMFFLGGGLTVESISEKDAAIAFPIGGFYLWGLLFGVFPFLWYRQRKWSPAGEKPLDGMRGT